MPPKRTSKRTVAAVSSSQAAAAAEMAGGANPGSFQLPPYQEDSPTLWFDYAEGLMDMRRITNPYFRATLVQQALTYAQQDAIAGVLLRKKEVGAYELIKNELLRLHEKDEWTRMRELLNIKSLGGQRGTELLSSMEKLAPQDNSLWLKFLFFSALPSSMQDLLAEEKGTARQLATRVDELQRKAPRTAAVAVAATAPEEVVAAAHAQPAKGPWKKKEWKKDRPKRRRSDQGDGHGGAATKRPRAEPWVEFNLCRFHWRYGDSATRCDKPCARNPGN